VKELNPGADLLFAADWDALVKSHSAAAPDLPTLAELARSAPETVTFGGDAPPPPAKVPESRVKRVPDSVFVAVGSFGLLLAAGGLWRMLRR
jgi:hypothetical protein